MKQALQGVQLWHRQAAFPGILFMEISGLKLGVIILTQSLYIFIPASGTGNILMNHRNV